MTFAELVKAIEKMKLPSFSDELGKIEQIKVPAFSEVVASLERVRVPPFSNVTSGIEHIPSTGRLTIDGKVATIDGEEHRIDFAVEEFRKVRRALEKVKV